MTNWINYPNELFASAPQLSPLGVYEAASRTSVSVFSDNQPLGVFDAFCGSSDLATKICFTVPSRSPPPSAVHIVMWDRVENLEYTSNTLSPPPLPSDSPRRTTTLAEAIARRNSARTLPPPFSRLAPASGSASALELARRLNSRPPAEPTREKEKGWGKEFGGRPTAEWKP